MVYKIKNLNKEKLCRISSPTLSSNTISRFWYQPLLPARRPRRRVNPESPRSPESRANPRSVKLLRASLASVKPCPRDSVY